jgi:hypothetical protein
MFGALVEVAKELRMESDQLLTPHVRLRYMKRVETVEAAVEALRENAPKTTWREKPVSDLAENLCQWLHNADALRAMSNAELVRECLKTGAADWDIVNEMMTRLHPGWENEPDEQK